MENDKFKLMWDFEFKLRKYDKATCRRPDLTLEDMVGKRIWLVDMACPEEQSIEEKTL